MNCFSAQMETESSKESLISFFLVEEEEKKLLVKKFALKDFNLVGFFAVEIFSCSGKKP